MSVFPAQYLQPPATIVNQALDSLGKPEKIIGDITDGTPIAECARRNYGQALRQLLRTAHWDFARARVKLQLLGDATGTNPLPVGVISTVEHPWGFAYAWPTDGIMGRWLPWSPTNAQPTNSNGVPLTTGGSAAVGYSLVPGRFLVASSADYPVVPGVQPWDQLPDLQHTEGVGPTYRKIILTDCCDAHFVYTRFVPVVEEWDSLFRQALVTMVALVLAPVAIEDPKLRLAECARLAPILKNAVADARVANGQEAGMPQSTDFEASFIRARNQWAWGYQSGLGSLGSSQAGYFSCGFESLGWGGSVF